MFQKKEKQKREKPVKKAASPPKPAQNEKPPKLRNLQALKLVRGGVYALLGLILLRGVLAILLPKDTTAATDELAAKVVQMQTDLTRQTQVSAFAQSFTRTYLSYEPRGNEGYRKALAQYCGDLLISDICETINLQNSATVTYAESLQLDQYAPGQYDVLVVADVIYTKYEAQPGMEQTPLDITRKDTLYLSVPVRDDGGQLVIEDIPLITAPPNPGTVTRQEYSAGFAEEADKVAAKLMLEDFFRTLYGDSQSKIDYYLADDANIDQFKARHSVFGYEKIDSLTLFADGTNYRGIVLLHLTDPNGTKVRQRFNVGLIKSGGKFYLHDLALRGYNLK